jgi:hypothetical protein
MSEVRKNRMTTVICAASLLLAACGGGEQSNEAAISEGDSNVMLEQIGNDASALEAAGAAAPMDSVDEVGGNLAAPGPSASESPSPPPASQTGASEPVLGETSGGDTGGNTVQGNVSGL